MSTAQPKQLQVKPSLHATLLEKIQVLGAHIADAHPIGPMPKSELSPMRKRSRFYLMPRLWHTRSQHMVWLGLRNPLWLGQDGLIYREYESLSGNSFMMRAEIELRDEAGLQLVLEALQKLDPCTSRSSP